MIEAIVGFAVDSANECGKSPLILHQQRHHTSTELPATPTTSVAAAVVVVVVVVVVVLILILIFHIPFTTISNKDSIPTSPRSIRMDGVPHQPQTVHASVVLLQL